MRSGVQFSLAAPLLLAASSKGLSLGVISKAFGMAGLRIGWLACQDKKMLKNIERVKHYTSICNSAPAKLLSLISLRNKDKILARNNKIVTANLKLLDQLKEFLHHANI
ncbi:MAG: aminotransferase class I/II-fold pyridoxal phosphate-dependent enzyme [Rickettsiaceae bacterium]|nr:aminotransferase class I/II-fold pyridoxal phosphate-dependent enzyme [Rickettsiaceae bacterium]MDP5020641.1 aminotransferase class I/II-fold pyridoxal phosphate-dependent enzyme [Rickettsiaceae bacterium]MDP5083014.1 aminotransferase class I/II-fold pyridoxal phosphate-dependent enzyme [Rickettsiaceae bacterium]